jgi:hypothetical protein
MQDTTKNKDIRIEEFKALMCKAFNFVPYDIKGAIEQLDKMSFFTVPASTKFHGAYSGGLFDHSKAVTEQLVNLTERLGLKWGNERSPYIVGMLHDLCKCDTYKYVGDENGKPIYIYNKETLLDGHGEKSVILVQNILHGRLTDEEIACIRWHMGAFDDKERWSYYNHAIKLYPNVLYTHTADMIASAILDT